MYRYDEFDAAFVHERVAQFRDQVARRLSGELSEDAFRPLRLMNGLYLQLHAYMLRVAIPYGTLSSGQLRALAAIARRWDRGFGHFTTRQNIQFNWPKLADVPDILEALAAVEMHAIQTSGNCIRNVTADHLAGAAADEVADPRPYAEIVRQWSSLHPELSFLPRKFKVAVIAAEADRAAILVHDIGLRLLRDEMGALGFAVYVGGGQGRTPMLAALIKPFLPAQDLLSYLEACLRVYNLYGRRDNKYKARIKILVDALGTEAFAAQVEAEWQTIRHGALRLPEDELARIAEYFAAPPFEPGAATSAHQQARAARDPAFADWCARNVGDHRVPGYAIVTVSLKPVGGIPGDLTADQMEAVADLAERFSFDEIRVSHEQNLVLAHVRRDDLPALHDGLAAAGLAAANAGLISDMIACPGLDYCRLASARSIPLAQAISRRFADREREIGPLALNISGCVNACGHHHVGHIGILGVEKRGEEHYQLLLGGSGAEDASLAEITGRGFDERGIVDAVETVVDTYLGLRESADERFIDVYRRLGAQPFKEALYGTG